MKTRELNCKITFQTPQKDSRGYSTSTWSDDFKKWARIQTSASGDVEQSGKQVVELTHIISCHYSKLITAEHRISHQGRLFEIIGNPINVNYRNTTTQLNCKEVTNA